MDNSGGSPVETIEEKYRCVQTLSCQGFSVEQVCRELEVSRSGYYDFCKGKTSERERRNQELRRRLVELHEKYPAMGLDSLYHLLKPEFGCSRKRVHRQMRLLGICSARRRAYKTTTNAKHSHPIAPNLLRRNFCFERPDQAWAGDITYIPTGEGWLYLAIVKDLCSRKIVGYAMSSRIDTQLTLSALDMAVRRQKPDRGLIFHSDRGVQYAAKTYRERLETYGIRQSMSGKGEPYDNAVAENFFSCLKCELVHLKHYPDCQTAQTDIFSYLEAFYNTVRPHSALGWITPNTLEALFYASNAA